MAELWYRVCLSLRVEFISILDSRLRRTLVFILLVTVIRFMHHSGISTWCRSIFGPRCRWQCLVLNRIRFLCSLRLESFLRPRHFIRAVQRKPSDCKLRVMRRNYCNWFVIYISIGSYSYLVYVDLDALPYYFCVQIYIYIYHKYIFRY